MNDTVADRRLHPGTLLIRFLRKVPEFVLGLPALVGFASNAGMRRILLIALIGAIVSFAMSLLGWLRFRYGVGERDLVIESGVLHRQRRVIPFDRVQDIDIEQGLLARMLGTAKVRIETGGAGKNEGNLDAVSLAQAHRLRELIRRRTGDVSAFQEREMEPEEPELFRMELPRLFFAGLFNFSFFYLALIAGALQYLQPLIGRRLPDPERWIASSPEIAASAGLYVTLVLAGLIILLGVITGVLRTITRDYNFRLTRAPAGFRRRRGLFTLSEVVIPLRRVQVAILDSGWLRRPLGWFSLSFQTLGTDAQQSGYQPAAPLARMNEVMPILRCAGIEELPGDGSYTKVSRLAVARRCLGSLVPLTAAAVLASLFWPPALFALFPLLLLAIAIILQWRRHRYVLTDRALYVAEGLLRRRLWIIPYAKAQTISVTRTPLQRALGLASLTIDTAGAALLSYPVISDIEQEKAEELAACLAEQYHAARLAAKAASPVQMVDPVDQRSADPALDEQNQGDGA